MPTKADKKDIILKQMIYRSFLSPFGLGLRVINQLIHIL